MMPQTSLHQHVVNWAISVPGDKTLKRDIFNNIWLTATQRYEYQHLTFMAQGIVELLNTEIGGVDVPIPSKIFLQSTAATQYQHLNHRHHIFNTTLFSHTSNWGNIKIVPSNCEINMMLWRKQFYCLANSR